MRRERCAGCGNLIPVGHQQRVKTADHQLVFVGPLCYERILKRRYNGWQPPHGGPRLYLTSHIPPKEDKSLHGDATCWRCGKRCFDARGLPTCPVSPYEFQGGARPDPPAPVLRRKLPTPRPPGRGSRHVWTTRLDTKVSWYGEVREARGPWGEYTVVPPRQRGGSWHLLYMNTHGLILPPGHGSGVMHDLGSFRDPDSAMLGARRHAKLLRRPMPS